LVRCGRIVSAEVSPQHFDYIFIDEAASECEQRTIIHIAGLRISKGKVNVQIVLCGNHKQLGAFVVNTFAKKMGMEVKINLKKLINISKINFFRCLSWSALWKLMADTSCLTVNLIQIMSS
jgi:superfamily I DNA and/or RNA helicase